MLGTRVIMLGMQHPPGSDEQNNAQVICVANHSIPIFWLMLFGPSDLKLFETQGVGQESLDSSEVKKYPVILTQKTVALARLEKHLTALQPLVPEADAELLHKWAKYINEIEFPMFALDTYELWNNREDQNQLHPELLDLLNSLDAIASNPSAIWEELKSRGNWQENNSISLAGYGW